MEGREVMDQSSENENSLSGGYESESRVKHEVEECAMNYNPCGETSLKSSAEIEFSKSFTKNNSSLQNSKDECLAEQSIYSSTDSNTDLYDNEELADLLRRYHAKFSRGLTAPSDVADRGDRNSIFESENSSSGGCESETRIVHDDKECAHLNYNHCGEAALQHSAEIHYCEKSDQDNFNLQNIKQEHLSEQSDTSLDDSGEDLSDSEEFADLLQRCYSRTGSDVMIHSADGDKETVRGSNNCVIQDLKVEDESEGKASDADNSVTQLTDTESTTVQAVSGRSQPADNRCPLCMKNFSDLRGLKRHIQRVHHNERPHRCTQCEKSFNVKQDLAQHIKRAHRGNKYQCGQCDFSSIYGKDLKRHISAVHLEEKPFKCPQCDASFSRKDSIVKHIKSIHNQEKSYECLSCDKKFSRHTALLSHDDAVHKGLKPHYCTECDGRFVDRSTLLRHVKNVHLKLRPYSCSICDKSFSQNISLRKHVDVVHTGQKQYDCDICYKQFAQKSHLISHKKSHR